MPILTLQDLETMHLPVDLSGYSPIDLQRMLWQAETWVNGETRHEHGFTSHRVIDRVMGTGTNKLFTTHYPICTLNSIALIFPANQGNVNLPGSNQVPIDPSRVVIDHYTGELINWSPFIFQLMGYLTVFPEGVPINIDYTTGYVSQVTTTAVQAGATYVPVDNASCFWYLQSVRFYDAAVPEWVTVAGTTVQGGVQAVVFNDPLLYNHPSGTNLGDMPHEVRYATALVACDFALRELNPEDLISLKEGNIQKQWQRDSVTRVTDPLELRPVLEYERDFIMEARRLLKHYYSDRGVR